MKDLVEYIVSNLVSKPEAVQVDEDRDNGNVNLTLTVDPSDMGLIIGKGGQTIRAIRKLLTVRAIGENVRVNLQLNEPAGSHLESAAEEGSQPEETEEKPAEPEEQPAVGDIEVAEEPENAETSPSETDDNAESKESASQEPQESEEEK